MANANTVMVDTKLRKYFFITWFNNLDWSLENGNREKDNDNDEDADKKN